MVISLSIGMLVYFLLIRPLLTERRDGEIRYRSLWPAWLSLEEIVYKPLFRWLIRVLMTLCRICLLYTSNLAVGLVVCCTMYSFYMYFRRGEL